MRWRAETMTGSFQGSKDLDLWLLPTNRVEAIINYLTIRIKEHEQEEIDDPEKFARRLVAYRMNLTATKADMLKYRWIKRLRITKLFMERELFYRGNHHYRGFVIHHRRNPKDSGMCLIFADALEDEIPAALGRSMMVMARKMRILGAGQKCPPTRSKRADRGPSPFAHTQPRS